MLRKYDLSAAAFFFAFATSVALGGCASGEDGDGSLASGASGGTGATGGGGASTTGGAGGGGGEGATGLCDQDCSEVVPPDCYVAVCNDGTYPGEVGACVVVEAEGGTPCDDGLFCTTQDGCQAGRCIGGPENTCGMLPAECQEVTCDEGAAACSFVPAQDGNPCASDDLCKVNAQCVAGECSAGVPKDCTFAPVGDCNEAVCNPFTGMCEGIPANDGVPCTDPMDLCMLGGTCDAGQCTGGTPITVCDPTSDGCCPSTCTAVDDPDCASMASRRAS